jgi:DprA winged helix domain
MTSKLTASERKVLGALMADAAPDARTIDMLARATGLPAEDALATVRQLENLDPPLVAHQHDATLGADIWIALETSIARLRPWTAGRRSRLADTCVRALARTVQPSSAACG